MLLAPAYAANYRKREPHLGRQNTALGINERRESIESTNTVPASMVLTSASVQHNIMGRQNPVKIITLHGSSREGGAWTARSMPL